MHPILFDFGGFTIYAYGVLLAAAYLLGLQYALVRARRRGLDAQRVMDLGIWIIISALVGAKLLLLIVDFKQFTENPKELLGLARSRQGRLNYGSSGPGTLPHLAGELLKLMARVEITHVEFRID